MSKVSSASPKLLYYFTSEKFGLEAIRDKRLKLARILELNDPFELMSVVRGKELDEIGDKVRKAFNETHGILCFCDDWKHPLMWGHYAAKHTGIALGFSLSPEFPPSKLISIRYSDERRKASDYADESEADQLEIIKEQMSTKAFFWSYEQESRAMITLDDPDPVGGLYFWQMEPIFVLHEVIIGERSNIEPERLRRVLGQPIEEVKMFKAKCSETHFTMERDILAAT